MEKLRDLPSEDTESTVSLAGRLQSAAAWLRRLYRHLENSETAQDLQRCNSVGGKQVSKKQYTVYELLPTKMLLFALNIFSVTKHYIWK